MRTPLTAAITSNAVSSLWSLIPYTSHHAASVRPSRDGKLYGLSSHTSESVRGSSKTSYLDVLYALANNIF
jgi:hypothetical protein